MAECSCPNGGRSRCDSPKVSNLTIAPPTLYGVGGFAIVGALAPNSRWAAVLVLSKLGDVERIGLVFILGHNSKDTFTDAELLFRTIKGLDWSLLPAVNQNVADFTGAYTSVYDGGY